MDSLTLDDIPELLARLADKSLIQADAEGRFDMLQLVRQFCQEEMARTDDGAEARRKHVLFYSELCAQKTGEIQGEKLFETNELFMTESENIRHAIEWAATHEDTWPLAARMLDDTFWLHFIRGAMTEGISLAELTLEHAPPNADPKTIAELWSLLGTFQQLSDHPDVVATCEKAMKLAEEAQSTWALARAMFQIAYFDVRQGRSDQGQAAVSRALELVRQVPNLGARTLELSMLTVKANSALMDGRIDEAEQYYEEYRVICDSYKNLRGFAVLYGNLSHLNERRGNYKAAHEYAVKPLEIFLRLSDYRNLAGTISSAASGYWLAEDYASATQALGCAYAIWERSESVPDTIDFVTAERWRKRLEEKMTMDPFKAAFERGKAIPPKEMVERLLANPEPWVQ